MNAGCCLGRFVVEKNSLRVTSPPELRDTYECAIGNFGVPEAQNAREDYLQNITVPSALISKSLGDNIKKALFDGEMVTINLDWRECLPHPDDRVEYEFWTNSNDECGPKCDSQIEYCAPDPDGDFDRGYDGKDVVIQNLRQACVFKVAKENSKPWIWWDYVTDFSIRCPMKENKYNKECADTVVKSLGVDLGQIDECMGDPNADVENPILTMEQEAQVQLSMRSEYYALFFFIIAFSAVYLAHKLVIWQFWIQVGKGKLDKGAVLKAICSGFEEMTEPAVCLSKDIETNECLENNGGCWQDKAANLTACKLQEHYIVELIMEAVGEIPRMEGHILLVLMIVQKVVCAHWDLEAMESVTVKMLMNAKKNWLVNAQRAIAKILGVVMTAPAMEIYCICENVIREEIRFVSYVR
ncbi:hypothetical protein ACET3Z_027626 [Daucus carota]